MLRYILFVGGKVGVYTMIISNAKNVPEVFIHQIKINFCSKNNPNLF